MSTNSWRFLGEPIYDSSNEESEVFEDLGKPVSYDFSHDTVQSFSLDIDNSKYVHMGKYGVDVEQLSAPSHAVDLY